MIALIRAVPSANYAYLYIQTKRCYVDFRFRHIKMLAPKEYITNKLMDTITQLQSTNEPQVPESVMQQYEQSVQAPL